MVCFGRLLCADCIAMLRGAVNSVRWTCVMLRSRKVASAGMLSGPSDWGRLLSPDVKIMTVINLLKVWRLKPSQILLCGAPITGSQSDTWLTSCPSNVLRRLKAPTRLRSACIDQFLSRVGSAIPGDRQHLWKLFQGFHWLFMFASDSQRSQLESLFPDKAELLTSICCFPLSRGSSMDSCQCAVGRGWNASGRYVSRRVLKQSSVKS